MNKRQQKKQQLKRMTNIALNLNAEAVEQGRMKPMTRKQAETLVRKYIAARNKAIIAMFALRKAAAEGVISRTIEIWKKRLNESQNDR